MSIWILNRHPLTLPWIHQQRYLQCRVPKECAMATRRLTDSSEAGQGMWSHNVLLQTDCSNCCDQCARLQSYFFGMYIYIVPQTNSLTSMKYFSPRANFLFRVSRRHLGASSQKEILREKYPTVDGVFASSSMSHYPDVIIYHQYNHIIIYDKFYLIPRDLDSRSYLN